jgi:ABC-type uncharacterized transport system substrate-binding protein
LTPLEAGEREALTQQLRTSVRLIDFSHFSFPEERPGAHFVVQLAEEAGNRKHWLHIDLYDNSHFVVFDLFDETNHKAYFKLNKAS